MEAHICKKKKKKKNHKHSLIITKLYAKISKNVNVSFTQSVHSWNTLFRFLGINVQHINMNISVVSCAYLKAECLISGNTFPTKEQAQ